MFNINNQIQKELEQVEQLKRRNKAKQIRSRNKSEKMNTRRFVIIGKIISTHFPEVLAFQPQRTNADNEIEFASVTNFVKWVALHKDYITMQQQISNHNLEKEP